MLAPPAGVTTGEAPEHASLLDAARRVAAEVLAPAAEDTDRAAVVPSDHLDVLARAGLDGLAAPAEVGGADAPPTVARDVYQALAGACGVTFFVWVQHHAPVRMLAASANGGLRDRWLSRLSSGDVLGGVAFAYLRRPGPPAVVARRVAGGWIVDGEAPWVTSWGLAGLFAVAARISGDGPVLFFALVPDGASATVGASAPLALAAMAASSTVRLRFDGCFVTDDDVISTVDIALWHERDRVATAQPHPAALGVAATAIRLLRLRADQTGQPAVSGAARSLAAELDDCRLRSYRLADEGRADDDHLARLVSARAWGLDVAARSAQALVAATGGGAMALADPAQRLVREAAFWSIQAQTAALRAATLGRVAKPQPPATS